MWRFIPCSALLVLFSAAQAQTDLFKYSVQRTLPSLTSVTALAFSADGTSVFVGQADGSVQGITLPDGGPQTIFGPGSAICSIAANRAASIVAAGAADGTIYLKSGGGVNAIKAHRRRVVSLAISPRSDFLASAGEDRKVFLWDAASGRELLDLPNPAKSTIKKLGFASGGASLIGVAENGPILEWDVKTRAILRQLKDDDESSLAADISFSGALMALSTEFSTMSKFGLNREANPADFHRENRLKAYDLAKGSVVKLIDGVDGELTCVSLSPDGRYAAAVRQRVRDAFLSVYDLQRGKEVLSLPSLPNAKTAHFSPDGSWLSAVAPDGALELLKVEGVGGFGAGEADVVADLHDSQIVITSRDKTPLIHPAKPVVIAVMDLDGANVDAGTAAAVSDMLRNRISGTPNVELVDRKRMQAVIKEQNFQFSDRVDALTAIQMGRVLNARKMIFGSVGKLGSSYTINAQMIDVETARIDGVREVLCQKCTLDDLPRAVAALKSALIAEQ